MPELLGYFLGPIGYRIVVIMMFFTWFGLGVAQILASATNYYAIDQTHSLRSVAGLFCLHWLLCFAPFMCLLCVKALDGV